MEITYAEYGARLKPQTAILLAPDDDPRYDVMYQFIGRIISKDSQIAEWVNTTNVRGLTPEVASSILFKAARNDR